MKIKVHEVEYVNAELTSLPKEFEFDILDTIAADDQSLADEVTKLIKESTGEDIVGCAVDVD
jgi:hypothetical protein